MKKEYTVFQGSLEQLFPVRKFSEIRKWNRIPCDESKLFERIYLIDKELAYAFKEDRKLSTSNKECSEGDIIWLQALGDHGEYRMMEVLRVYDDDIKVEDVLKGIEVFISFKDFESIPAIHGCFTPLTVDDIKRISKSLITECQCEMSVLMNRGCICGVK